MASLFIPVRLNYYLKPAGQWEKGPLGVTSRRLFYHRPYGHSQRVLHSSQIGTRSQFDFENLLRLFNLPPPLLETKPPSPRHIFALGRPALRLD